ncbi:hypothetical protein HDU92_003574 [Lobulomyces angularis]|nr:hypothetical protein HDU92_003574 [Lobulomyces angularis]
MLLTETNSTLKSKKSTMENNIQHNSDVESAKGPDKEESTNFVASTQINSKVKFFLILFALACGIFLAALDQTIVSTAIPAIGEEFKQFHQIAWIGSSYFLTASSFCPLYGKLSDIFGRKIMYISAILWFEVGSFICGIANSMIMLIIGRAISGIGGGGLFAVIFIIISDITTFDERGKYQGIVGAVFGLSSVVGPLFGGLFTDSTALTWRWCFYINLPVGFFTVVIVTVFLPNIASVTNQSIKSKLKRIDYLGIVLLILAVIFFTIPVQAGGNVWPWNSWQVITLFCSSFVFTILFIFAQHKISVEPIIPFPMFVNVSIVILSFVPLFLGATFFAFVFYISIYLQVVQNQSATDAGFQTIPLLLAVVVFSIASGMLVSKLKGKYHIFLIVGSATIVIGNILLSRLEVGTPRYMQYLYMIIMGVGVGNVIQTRLLGIQASVEQQFIAIATSVSTFAMTMGGVIGIAVIGAIFTNVLGKKMELITSNLELIEKVIKSPSQLRSIIETKPLQDQAINAVNSALQTSFLFILCFSGLLFISTCFLKEYRNGVPVSKKL